MKQITLILIAVFFTNICQTQNTINNASFETSDGQGGVNLWGKRPTTAQDASVFYTNNHSYKLNADTNQYSYYGIDPTTIEVGREYTISIWTKTQNYASNEYAYWRYVNLDINEVQASAIDLNTNTTQDWTHKEWNFYPRSTDARLDLYWTTTSGTLWVDDISMHKKDRVVEKIHALPEPWRLNIGDNDTGELFVELHDSDDLRVSNATDEITFVNLDPTILTLDSPTIVNAVYGKASLQFSGTNTPGIGRIEIQSEALRDTIQISNREKLMPDNFFHIGTMLYAWGNETQDTEMLQDLENLGMNIIFPINGPPEDMVSIMNTIQTTNSNIKVIAQTNLTNSNEENYFEPTRRWDDAVAKAQEYTDLFTPFGDILYGYRLSDEPNLDLPHHRVAYHSNALYAADPTRQAITIDASAYYLTHNNMRIRNNDFKLTYIYPFNVFNPIGTYPFDYNGVVDSETAFEYLSNYDNKPWFHMIQSWTSEALPPYKRWPIPEEMKQQAYSAVSFGAKGIYYFFYHDLPGHPQEIRGIVEAGYPTVHRQLWQPAQQINWNLRNNERVFIEGVHSASSTFASSTNTNVRIADFELSEPNGKYIMLVNRDALNTTSATLNISVPDIDSFENKFDNGGTIVDYNSNLLDVELLPGDAMLIQLKNSALSINDYDESLAFSCYPNPAKKNININWKVKNDVDISIYSVLGQVLHHKIYDNMTQSTSINVENYHSGVYFIVLQSKGNSVVKKIVVE